MRKLILTRGAPGCGKSSLLQDAGLMPFSLSMDLLRQLRAAPEMLPNGQVGISQERNDLVFQELRERVEARMRRGELVAIDNTMPSDKDLEDWTGLAAEHGYSIAVLDFSGMPLDRIQAQNRQRPAWKQVGEAVVERIHKACQAPLTIDPARVHLLPWDGGEGMRKGLDAFLEVPVLDFSAYRKVVHIGDLQGCLTVLTGPGGPLEHGFEDDMAYVFVGDLLDRGIENGALFRWYHDVALPRSNVFLMWGNHEDHPYRWSRGQEAVSREFRDRTLPQLIEAGVTPEMAGAVCASARDVLPYRWRGQNVMVTHAGLSNVPDAWAQISSFQYSHGTGHWSDPVDAQFERHAPANWVQVHGHRNHGAVAIQATPRSFNLEDAVEFGGHLRVATLDERGWTTQAFRNNVFEPSRARKRREREEEKTSKRRQAVAAAEQAPEWMARECETRMDDATLAAMRSHSGVRVRNSKQAPHVIAVNFTKQVFFQASWDDLLVKARGLFLNDTTQEIVARGYEKFFNVGERPETKLSALAENMAWPVVAFVKENGYLGNLGYDAETGELFVASKSTPDGDFAGWFREILNASVPGEQQERLRRWLRDNEASMVFEVIDPVRDPHMIDYPGAKLVLLDIFHRSATPEKLSYDQLKAVGERFGLEVKRRAIEFKTPEAFLGWYGKACTDLSWRFRNEDIEGLVLEDQKGFQTKVKMPHYAFWKRMRSAKERLAKLLVQLETTDGDDARARQQALLEAMGVHKATLATSTDDATRGFARAALQKMGGQLRDIQAELAGRERREHVETDITALIQRDPHPLAQAFLTWASQQSAESIKADSILELRSRFIQQATPDPALWRVPWAAFDEDNGEESEPDSSAPKRGRGPKP